MVASAFLQGADTRTRFRTGGQMRGADVVAVIETAGTFKDDIDAVVGMRDGRRVAFMRHRDAAGADIHPAFAMADRRRVRGRVRVELIEMRRCLDRAGCVDQNNLDIFPSVTFHKGAKNHAPDAAKAADCESKRHVN